MRIPAHIAITAASLIVLGTTAAQAQSNIPTKSSAQAHPKSDPTRELQAALNDLQNARSVLAHAAADDTNGHRGRAIDKIDQAEVEIRANMKDGAAHR